MRLPEGLCFCGTHTEVGISHGSQGGCWVGSGPMALPSERQRVMDFTLSAQLL